MAYLRNQIKMMNKREIRIITFDWGDCIFFKVIYNYEMYVLANPS